MARSISGRLTLSLALVSASMFLAAGLAIYVGLNLALERATRVELLGTLRVVRHFVEEAVRSGDLQNLQHRMDDIAIGHTELRVWLLQADGQPVYGNLALPMDQATSAGFFTVTGADGIRLEAIRSEPMDAHMLGIYSAVVALDTAPRFRLLRFLLTLMGTVAVVAVLLAVVLGWAAVRRGLGPLQRLSEESAAISPNAPGRRLTTAGIDRELQELAVTFNAVLDRLESAYRQIEAFNADVAHELRTPLATLISGTQLALVAKRPIDQLVHTLASNLEELETLRTLVNDMLFLAQADHGALAQGMVATDLHAEALKVLDFFEAWLAESELRAGVVGAANARCAPAMFRRAVANLLSNAIKFTPRGGTIRIELDEIGEFSRVSVINPGARVDQETRRRMFDRFFRGDPARGRLSESHGLGLAIVRAVAQMHRGHVFAESVRDETRIGLMILKSPPQVLDAPGAAK